MAGSGIPISLLTSLRQSRWQSNPCPVIVYRFKNIIKQKSSIFIFITWYNVSMRFIYLHYYIPGVTPVTVALRTWEEEALPRTHFYYTLVESGKCKLMLYQRMLVLRWGFEPRTLWFTV